MYHHHPSSPRWNLSDSQPKSPAYDPDLYALWRQDPSIVSTFARFDRVTFYHDQRDKDGFEGRMVVYERATYPVYGFCILNDRSAIVHIQHLYPEDDISVHGNAVKIKSYPDFTDRRLSLACSSSAEVVYKFSDIYNIPNLDSLDERSKGVSKVVGLSASAEDIKVLMGLHAYIRINKPYPKERMSASNRFPTHQSSLHTISVSTPPPPSPSPSLYSSTSDSSPLFSSSSPPTTPSPSPSSSNPTSPLQCQMTHDNPANAAPQINNDYRHRALLNSLVSSSPANVFVPRVSNEQAPKAVSKVTTERTSMAGNSGATRLLNRNLAVSARRAKGSTSQRLPSSGLAQFADSSDLTVSSEAVTSTHQLRRCSDPPGRVVNIFQSSFAAGGPEAYREMPTDLDGSTSHQPCPDLFGQYHKVDQYSFARGTFSDIYRGKSRAPEDDNISVAIKIIRIPGFKDDDDNIVKTINTRLDRETKVWNSLRHQNVLPFLGISREFGPFPALISPYCPSRDVVNYLKHHPHVDRGPIALGLTDGLRYLHSRQVIHGDLKGSNVLIGTNGEALICDFGVSKVIDCQDFTASFFGTPGFMAPELFPDFDEPMVIDEDAVDNDTGNSPFRPQATKETDIYAYGIVSLQILTGKDPIIRQFVTRKTQVRPRRQWYNPQSMMSEQLWRLIEICCDPDPNKRPTMEDVMRRVSAIGFRTRSNDDDASFFMSPVKY